VVRPMTKKAFVVNENLLSVAAETEEGLI